MRTLSALLGLAVWIHHNCKCIYVIVCPHFLTVKPSCLTRSPASRCPKFDDKLPVTVLAYELANMGSFHKYWDRHPDLGIDKLLRALLGVATGM